MGKQVILVVDDEQMNRQVLTNALTTLYEVKLARDGRSCFEMLDKYSVDLVLLDIVLPDMSGWDIIKEIKETDKWKDIPVIFVTGLTRAEDEERGLRLGAVDYIHKPFHMPIVQARVKTHLRLSHTIQMLATYGLVDELTELNNRRSFNQNYKVYWATARRLNQYISLMMLDIDFFKKFNDTYGHAVGDLCLKLVADVMKSSLHRESDLPFRLGGEELAILLINTPPEYAFKLADLVRCNIEHAKLQVSAREYTNVTVSIGIGTIKPDGHLIPEGFMEMVDKALYKAKHLGRNQVQEVKGG
jgi:diguanylate cyclase (GGDEF)-like protein